MKAGQMSTPHVKEALKCSFKCFYQGKASFMILENHQNGAGILKDLGLP